MTMIISCIMRSEEEEERKEAKND
jgi:hypothetical protein